MNKNLFFYTVYFLSVSSIVCGLLCAKYPDKAILFQQRFYLKINWRIEPVSLKKEIRNTRIMGLFLILLGFTAAILIKILTP